MSGKSFDVVGFIKDQMAGVPAGLPRLSPRPRWHRSIARNSCFKYANLGFWMTFIKFLPDISRLVAWHDLYKNYFWLDLFLTLIWKHDWWLDLTFVTWIDHGNIYLGLEKCIRDLTRILNKLLLAWPGLHYNLEENKLTCDLNKNYLWLELWLEFGGKKTLTCDLNKLLVTLL